ncbi:MAG TPA: extracellular solute-binding protein [Steroidobacteraceae bacterium]|nr:extracellular solute-binding protein [Steroidobacteraceae bacterium]
MADRGDLDFGRRRLLAWLAATPAWAVAGAAYAAAVQQDAAERASAISLLGDLKYSPGFENFDYVNPHAPKGGSIRISAIATFDSLNPLIVQGTAARGALMVYESLMTASLDEPASQYPLVAQEIEYPSDFSWVTFHLNPKACFHDGVPLTADDVVFSVRTLREKGLPSFRQYYAHVKAALKIDDHTVKFSFDQRGNREFPATLGQLIYVLPRHFWEGRDTQGRPRDFARSALELPVGSGPYRVGRFETGRFIEYLRVENHWGRNLPVNVGQHNFDVVRYDFYRDVDVAVSAFLGGATDVRLDMSPKSWATRYDVPAVRDGRILRTIIPDDDPNGMQGYFFNLRRSTFQDRRVRLALVYAFDFEWTNRHLLYGLTRRLNSYFQNSELAATGIPSGAELELLRPFKTQLPPELFERPFRCPVSRGDGNNRDNLRIALTLLEQAGYVLRGGRLFNAGSGEPFKVEFIDDQPGTERVLQPYLLDLLKIGVQATLRIVDTAQLQNRLGSFDFDIVSDWKRQSRSPGNELREFFGSKAADLPGSDNTPGLKQPAVDALIERIVFARDRPALVAAARALDRVLLWDYLCIPQWTLDGFPCAYWNRFGLPKSRQYLGGMPSVWWQESAPEGARSGAGSE